jgi:hypothetical protein
VLKTGTGLTIGSAGVGDCKERSRTSFCDAGVCAAAAGVAIGAGAGAATGVGVGVADCAAGATGAGVCATGVGVTGAAAAFGVGGVPPRGAPAIGALVEEVEEVEEVEPEEFGLYVLKNSIQDGSSEVGSDK